MKRLLLASLGAVLLLVPSGAGATAVAVPITYGGGPYLVGFEVESVEQKIDSETFRSIRYLGRVSMRVRDPLVVSFRVGGSEIDVESEVHGKPTTFEGRPKLALGAGAGYYRPLATEHLAFFADAGALFTLSSGRTSFSTTIQSNTFHEEYENRYRWIEYQAAGGLRMELPFGGAEMGALLRTVDGKVWRDTYQAGELAASSEDDFSRAPALSALAGIDFRLPGRFFLSLVGSAESRDDFTFTVSIAEVSR